MISMEKEEGVMVKGRATIDTRPPFRSVKEAVALFGERVLVGEIYAKQLKEVQPQSNSDEVHDTSTLGSIQAELEEAKQNLKKAREESNYMANSLKSVGEELEQTKRELRKLKATKEVVIMEHQHSYTMNNPEIEELKFVEDSISNGNNDDHNNNNTLRHEFQKKKFVSFASPPSLTREMMMMMTQKQNQGECFGSTKLGRTPSFRKEAKKKQLVSSFGWLFPKRKRNFENSGDCSPNA